jgi:hypothetical protein
MWLMTKYGFYSIVQKRPGIYHVRAREVHDLYHLIDFVPLPGREVRFTGTNDYLARLILNKEELDRVMTFLSNNIDYDNFKDKIDKTPEQRRKPYHKIWQVLADALGAYGMPPKKNGGEKVSTAG